MVYLNHDLTLMKEVLASAKTIAVVGHSDHPSRTSYQIAQFLRRVGYTIYPVNPQVALIDGEICYPSLADLPAPVDIVNVFRRAEHLIGVVREAIQINAKTVWGQLEVYDDAALDLALSAKLHLAMDRCIKVEYLQLGVVRHG